MQCDSVESHDLEPAPPVLTTHKQATKPTTQPTTPSGDGGAACVRPAGKEGATWSQVGWSPTSVTAPMITPPPPLTLPAAVLKPSLPSTAVWAGRAPTVAAAARAATKNVRWADSRAVAESSSSSDTLTPTAPTPAALTEGQAPTRCRYLALLSVLPPSVLPASVLPASVLPASALPAARGSMAQCRKHGQHSAAARAAAMLGQVPMPSARETEAAEKAEAAEKLQAAAKAEAMEKWIDELKLQARPCRILTLTPNPNPNPNPNLNP